MSSSIPLWKRIVALLVFLVLLAALIGVCTRALTPYVNKTGVTWRRYEAEPRNSIQMLFFGSSYVFCDICPAELYARTGYTSYVVGGPTLSAPMIWCYLRQALQTQQPDVVFVDLGCVDYAHTTNYPEINIGMMPWGFNRVAATLDCAPQELRKGLLFPLYSYHDAWNQLSAEEVRMRLTDRSVDMAAGYCYYSTPQRLDFIPDGQPDLTSPAYRSNLEYLRKIADLCRRKKIPLVFTNMPGALSQQGLSEQLRQDVQFYEEIQIWDFAVCDMGLISEVDFFDAAHMNYSGAVKLATYFAEHLDELHLTFGSKDFDHALWDARVDYIRSPERAAESAS